MINFFDDYSIYILSGLLFSNLIFIYFVIKLKRRTPPMMYDNSLLDTLMDHMSTLAKNVKDLQKEISSLNKNMASGEYSSTRTVLVEPTLERGSRSIKKEDDAPMFIPSIETGDVQTSVKQTEDTVVEGDISSIAAQLAKVQGEK